MPGPTVTGNRKQTRRRARRTTPTPTPGVRPGTDTTAIRESQERSERKARRKARRTPTPPTRPGSDTSAIREAQAREDRKANQARHRRSKRRKAEARALRDLSRIANKGPLEGEIQTPAEIARHYEQRAKRRERQADYYDRTHQEGLLDTISDTAERVTRHGVVGEIDKELASVGREILTGSKNPSVGELALAAAPLPAAKGASLIRAALRSRKLLNTAKGAKVAKATIEEARTIRKAERAAARAKETSKLRKARATGRGMSRQARQRLAKTEAKAAAKRTAKRSADRALRSATSPVVASVAASPGAVGEQVREIGKAHLEADIPTTLATTGKAIPGLFAYGATLGAGVAKAATGQGTGSLESSLSEGKEALKALDPLLTGDSDEIAAAMEDQLGYPFAPLALGAAKPLGRGAGAVAKGVGKGAAAGGRQVARPVKATGRQVEKALPEKTRARIEQRRRTVKTHVGPARRVRQIVAGTPSRAKMKKIHTRTAEQGAREAALAVREETKASAPLHRRWGADGEDLSVVLHEYGITPDSPATELQRVLDDFDARGVDGSDSLPGINQRQVIDWALKHPDVFKDKALWETVNLHRSLSEETRYSSTAQNVAQARVLGVKPRHEYIPDTAKAIVGDVTRTEAWKQVDKRTAEIAELKAKAGKLRARAKEAKGQRRQQLLSQARLFERAAKRRKPELDELRESLDPFTRPGHSLNGKRLPWSPAMAKQFNADVAAARKGKGLREGGLVSDRGQEQPIGQTGGANFPRTPAAQKVKSGQASALDAADRSLPSFLKRTVHDPRVARALREFVRETIKEFKVKIPGTNRYVLRDVREWNDLVRDKLIDPREYRLVPIRFFQQGIRQANIDDAVDAVTNSLRRELDQTEQTPGTRYVIMKNEDAIEFAHQLDPKMDVGVLSHFGAGASRLLLGTNPAWLEAQFVNEGTQALVAVNPYRQLKGYRLLRKWARENPDAYRAFVAAAGDNPTVAHSLKPDELIKQLDPTEAYRFSRKTPVGRILADIATVRTLTKIDQAKGAKIRAMTLAGHIDRELNSLPKRAKREVLHWFKGLAGMQDIEYALAKKLKALPPEKRAGFLTSREGKALFDKHLDYLDDAMGNWQAFTRFERKYAPALIFYPYIRMSLRWTFANYPNRHPVKAQLLYLFAQQNNEELQKLLGREATFFEAANPVVFGEDGEIESVLPGGRRFGAPGSNAIVEAVGAGNLTGVLRALNPLAAASIRAATGVDTFGEQVQFEGNVGEQALQRGIAFASELLGLPGPARVALDKARAKSPASEKLDELDPQADLRSLALPFIPQPAEDFRKQRNLIADFSASSEGIKSEVGQIFELIDAVGPERALQTLKDQQVAKGNIKRKLGEIPQSDDPAIQKVLDYYYGKIKYPDDEDNSSKGGWYANETTGSPPPTSGWYGKPATKKARRAQATSGWYD